MTSLHHYFIRRYFVSIIFLSQPLHHATFDCFIYIEEMKIQIFHTQNVDREHHNDDDTNILVFSKWLLLYYVQYAI